MKNLPWNYLSPIIYLFIGTLIMVIVGIFIKLGVSNDALVALVGLGSALISAIVNKLRTVRPEEPVEPEEKPPNG